MAFLSIVDPKAKALILVSGGGATSTEDLQFAGDIAAGQDFGASALVCLNEDKQIEAGLATDTNMPMWAINGAMDYDSGQFNYNLMKPEQSGAQGIVNCLVATGGFELAVTEYNDTDYQSADYAPGNTLLTNDPVNLGWVMPAPAAYSTVTIVGCVSTGIDSVTEGLGRARRRLNQKALLRFWTMFIPPVVLEASSATATPTSTP